MSKTRVIRIIIYNARGRDLRVVLCAPGLSAAVIIIYYISLILMIAIKFNISATIIKNIVLILYNKIARVYSLYAHILTEIDSIAGPTSARAPKTAQTVFGFFFTGLHGDDNGRGNIIAS